MIEIPVQSSDFINHVQQWLNTQAQQTDQSFPNNSKVTYEKERLAIQCYRRPTPPDLAQLESLLTARLEPVHLLDILMDTEL